MTRCQFPYWGGMDSLANQNDDMRRGWLIWNPRSGGGKRRRKKQVEQAAQVLAAHGWELELKSTPGRHDAAALARQAAELKLEGLWICGGDGTLAQAAGALVEYGDHAPAIGILSGGTANVLARQWNVPLDPVGAAKHLALGRPATLPLGRARRQGALGQTITDYFVALASAGYDGWVVHAVERSRYKRWGRRGYAWMAMLGLGRYRFAVMRAGWQDAYQQPGSAAVLDAVFALTDHYAGGFPFGWDRPYGEPAIWLLHDRGARRRWLSINPTREIHAPSTQWAQWVRAGVLELEGEPAPLELDGEPKGFTPVIFDVLPEGWKVLLP